MTTITITIQTDNPGAANILLNKMRMQNPDATITSASGPDPDNPDEIKTYEFDSEDPTKAPDRFLKSSWGQ